MTFLRRLILHNFWLKFASIALATVIWLAIHHSIYNDSYKEYIHVPISVKTAPGDKRVFRVTPNDVMVIFVCEDAVMRREARKDIQVTVDLTDFKSKEAATLKLQVEAPREFNVLDISPAEAEIQQVSP